MPSLVEQLQRDAADPNISVGTLLRRAKISAKKLGLKKVEAWIEHELSGYTDGVPEINGKACCLESVQWLDTDLRSC